MKKVVRSLDQTPSVGAMEAWTEPISRSDSVSRAEREVSKTVVRSMFTSEMVDTP